MKEDLMTLNDYIELNKLSDDDKINISFEGINYYRYRVKNIKGKHPKMLSYYIVGKGKNFITISKKIDD